jgi:glycosyltransferase involved in cell wall biosynthesis
MQDDRSAPSRLDFFGDGVLRADLEAEAAALGVSGNVRFHGFRADVRDFLAGLDVFLTVATQEMAPISMLEAMAAELPIIGTPHAGTVEMIADGVNGAVVDWNVCDVAAAMRVARDDASWRRKCGAAGRQLVERNYDIARIADQHVEFYRRLMRTRPAVRPADLHLTAQL